MKLYILVSLLLISQISSLSYTFHYFVHDDSEYAKVCTLDNKNVLVLSSVLGVQKTKESKLDKTGEVIYGNMTLDVGYTASGQMVQPHAVNGTQSDPLFVYHNRQTISGHSPKEMLMEYNSGVIHTNNAQKNSLYAQKSVIALESGKVLIAGIDKVDAFGSSKNIEINIYDPIAKKFGSGLTFSQEGYSKYLSCYEQKKNEVYCIFISYEDVFVSKLRIKHITINDSAMSLSAKDSENKQIIKNFYTVFTFIKAIKFDDDEAIVIFQTGNGEKLPRYGNTGKDLYYYHLKVNGDSISVKRYEYLYDACSKIDDPEDYKVDVAVLNGNRIYVACETDIGRFRGFIIYPDKEGIDEFNFNNFNAETVKNPVFAKFDKSLGIFYTHISETLNSRVAYHIMNYPDCFDYKEKPFLLPKHFTKDDFDFSGKVFINNPYPASRANEKISFRFGSFGNMTIVNLKDNKNIVAGNDYEPNVNLKFSSVNQEGHYSIFYTATRKDDLDGEIIGKTCKVNFFTPKCLSQCYSCTKTGNEAKHYCLGCASVRYYEEKFEGAENEGYGIPHNCHHCNDSCYDCYGKNIMSPVQTTNCKRCDYDNGYYHYEYDERTCISNKTQNDWEEYLDQGLYLDDTPKDKKDWRWRHCHSRCRKCAGRGTDENNNCTVCREEKGFYFFCNQTLGNGIPGSCHNDCVDNGFYLSESEGMKKCCPCFDHCKVCPNNTLCNKCFEPFFRMPKGEQCVDECPYCLAEDRKKWQCVNCKTDYETPMYNLNKTCVTEDQLPIKSEHPHLKGRKHHVIDEQCNLVMGCKEGCFKCDGWYTEHCTVCHKGFYQEDFFGEENPPKTFRCFKERECQGLDLFQFDGTKHGGITKTVNNVDYCYNCWLREKNYRQVANNFTCGPRAKRTYISIPHYGTLEKCYTRCASCDDWGNSCFHNCTTCRDSSTYGLEPYKERPKYGNCVRYTHKCKDLPYYHDYDLADQLGIDEDNCGQDCDVCLTNRTCTENFPYFVVATRECVELCPLTDVLSNVCTMNHPNAGFILLQNPFDLQNTFMPINQTVNINQVISSTIFQKFAEMYHVDVKTVSDQINNYLGTGQIFNLPKSEIIIGNNISIELTSVKLELEKLLGQFTDGSSTTTETETEKKNETSILDISECEKILKKKYGLSDEESLMIIKGDTLKELSEQYLGNQVDYQLFSTSLGAFLPLSDCKNADVSVTVTNPFNVQNLLSQFASKTGAVIENGYDAFDINSPFYNDVCSPFTNENGNDVLIDERRTDYFNEQLNLCEKGCKFDSFNISTYRYSCKCPIKDTINENNEKEVIITKEMPEEFYKKHKNSNIEVFKCASQVFSTKGQQKNFGSYVLIACFLSFIGAVVYYIIKGSSKINVLFNNLENNPIPANPPKPKEAQKVDPNEPIKAKADYDSNSDVQKKPKNVGKDNIIIEEQLNNADFDIAKKYDTRGYLKLYWSLLKLKQLIIFTFFTSTDYNLRVAKIVLFILFVSYYFAFTALFFNDSIMRQIYIYKGNTDAAVHVPNIILSSLCCLIMNFIVRFVSLTERDISKISCAKENRKELCDKTKKILKIKLIILFAISGALIALCWYYVAAFCAVFKNSQGHYFINVLIAFIVCNLWPCFTSLIPPIFRRIGLKKNSRCMYTASQIIAYV